MNALHPARALGRRVGRITVVVVMALAAVVVMPLVSMVSASANTSAQGTNESTVGVASGISLSAAPLYVWALLGVSAVVVGLLVAGRHSSSDVNDADRGLSAPYGSIG